MFVPLGIWMSLASLNRGDDLRALAYLIQVVGALLALPLFGLVRWPHSDSSLLRYGAFAIAIFLGGKILEWHLRNGPIYAIGFTTVVLLAGAVLWWLYRELHREPNHPAQG